ncbi:acyltransferase [Pseudarthrobacter sp. B907]|uniref:acyltransferase n=1 Tax=Pseudarthrobacter sp. B907 TaxID=3158261 RepID=UPI0032DB137C
MSKVAEQLKATWIDAAINGAAGSYIVPRRVRGALISLISRHQIDPSANIAAGVFLGGIEGLTIGPHSFVNYRCFIDLTAPVTIGAKTSLAYEVIIATSSHELGGPQERAGNRERRPVNIGNGCWIGARVTILPGVSIGDGCVIAAGSVVTTDCEPNGFYAGVPAELKRILA